jgi:hypothetical protein
MYYVSGIVKDEKGVGIPRVLVRGGTKMIFTDANGSYQTETDMFSKKITFFKLGYKANEIDLSKYPNDSSVNGSITLIGDSESIVNPNAGSEQTGYKGGNPYYAQSEEKGLSKKQMKVIGVSLIGVALILTSVLIFRAVKK